MSSLRDLLQSADKRLIQSDTPRLDAEILLAETLRKDRTWLFTWPEHRPSPQQISEFEARLARRLEGEPVAYILGRREFWGIELECDTNTLIPRPETELLVETALGLDLPAAAQILDLGTGTGAIALALKSERPDWQITAIDLVPGAIDLARSNASRLDILDIEWRQGSWFEPLADAQLFDLIISNPPYVETSSPYLSEGDVRFEPRSALVSGEDGMRDIREIITGAKSRLKDSASLLIEHGAEQGDMVERAFRFASYKSLMRFKDLSGLDRATIASI